MKKNNHLTLVDSSNLNPNNLTYDQVEDKINGLMMILDMVQSNNLETEFPYIENQIKQYIEIQDSLTPQPPPVEEEIPSNVVDLSLLFAFKKFTNEKRQSKIQLPENVINMYPSKGNGNEGFDVG